MASKSEKIFTKADLLHLRAAEGWVGLGDLVSAHAELDEINPRARQESCVLAWRHRIYVLSGKWDLAAEVAETLVEMTPFISAMWIDLAIATRRKTGGSIPDAKRILLVAQVKFPEESLIPYHLACCCAQIGELEESERWFKKAMALNKKKIQKLAVDQPDLKPLLFPRS